MQGSQILRVKRVRWFLLQSHHWSCVLFFSRCFGVLSCQQCFSNCDQNCFFCLVGFLGGSCLLVCLGVFVFEGSVFLFVLETSGLKKIPSSLATCVKSQNCIRKLFGGCYLLEIINQQPSKGLNYLLQLHFQPFSYSLPEGAGIAPDITPGVVPAWPCDQLFECI